MYELALTVLIGFLGLSVGLGVLSILAWVVLKIALKNAKFDAMRSDDKTGVMSYATSLRYLLLGLTDLYLDEIDEIVLRELPRGSVSLYVDDYKIIINGAVFPRLKEPNIVKGRTQNAVIQVPAEYVLYKRVEGESVAICEKSWRSALDSIIHRGIDNNRKFQILIDQYGWHHNYNTCAGVSIQQVFSIQPNAA